MMSILQKPSKIVACGVVASFLAATNVAFAQQAQGWPAAENPSPYGDQQQSQAAPNPPQNETQPPYAADPGPYQGQQQPGPYAQQAPNYPPPPQQQQGPYQQNPYPQQPGPYAQRGPAYPSYGPNPYYSAPPAIPAELTVSAGTPISVRVNQTLKADRDHPGTMFTATLVEPLIVNGVVAAQPGSTVTGQVVETQDSRGVRALGKYGLLLTSVTLADGQQLPIHAPITSVREHGPSAGQDVGTMATTTALGAIIGGAIGWGTGAAIGAGVGALAGAGILVNEHAHDSIKPEELMTFSLAAPVEISTVSAPNAFHWVQPGEFSHRELRPRYAYAPAPVVVAPYPYYYGYYGPYWYGPGIGFTYWRGGWGHRHWR